MTDRIPCCVEGCKRTADATKFEPGAEIICAKHWADVPQVMKARYRQIRVRWRKAYRCWQKHQDSPRALAIYRRIVRLENRNWFKIKAYMNKPDTPPEGLPGFLRELGLD